MAKQATTTKQDKAPKQEDAAKEAKRKERQAKRRARKQKRQAKLKELLDSQGQVAVDVRATFAEYKHGVQDVINPTPNATWKEYCNWKAEASREYWQTLGDKPRISEKAIARKKAKLAAMKAKLEKLQAELANID